MKKLLFPVFLLVSLSPLMAQSGDDHPMQDLYRFLLQPKTALTDTLLSRDQEFFLGADLLLSPEQSLPFDGVYALFGADRYRLERLDATGIWYAGFYARQGELVTWRLPLAFTMGWTMSLPGRKLNSWALDWTWFGLTDNPQDDRNYLSLGLYGLRYGIGFRNLFAVEYHSWGVYDLDVLVGWLTAFLRWDPSGGNIHTDFVLADIQITRTLAVTLAALVQLISEGRFSADYGYLWPSITITAVETGSLTLGLRLAGGVTHREGEYLWGGSAAIDMVIGSKRNQEGGQRWRFPFWLRIGAGINDREAAERLRQPGLVTLQLTAGYLFDIPEKYPQERRSSEPFWKRFPARGKSDSRDNGETPSDGQGGSSFEEERELPPDDGVTPAPTDRPTED